MFGNLEHLIQNVGYAGLFFIIFAESGLFFGFFFPGDSLLLTAGLLCSRGILDIQVLLPLLFVAAFSGDQVGYWFGYKTGPLIFNREGSLLFRRENLLKAKAFYDQHGAKTVTFARFLPFIRTFAPIVAGAVAMPYRVFIRFSVLGGLLWAVGMTSLGWFLGVKLGKVEGIDKYFTLLVLAFFLIPGLPGLYHLIQGERERRAALAEEREREQDAA